MRKVLALCCAAGACVLLSLSIHAAEGEDLLAAAVASSYGDCDLGAQVGICAVVFNRVAASDYPNTVAEVIAAADSGFDLAALAAPIDEKAMRIARDALAAAMEDDPTEGCLRFARLPKPGRGENHASHAASLDLSDYRVVIGDVGFS